MGEQLGLFFSFGDQAISLVHNPNKKETHIWKTPKIETVHVACKSGEQTFATFKIDII